MASGRGSLLEGVPNGAAAIPSVPVDPELRTVRLRHQDDLHRLFIISASMGRFRVSARRSVFSLHSRDCGCSHCSSCGSMSVAVIAITRNGARLGGRLRDSLPGELHVLRKYSGAAGKGALPFDELRDLVAAL